VATGVRALTGMATAVACAFVLFTGIWMMFVGSSAEMVCALDDTISCDDRVMVISAFGAGASALGIYGILVLAVTRREPERAAAPIVFMALIWLVPWFVFAVKGDLSTMAWLGGALAPIALALSAALALAVPWAKTQPELARAHEPAPGTEEDESIWPWQRSAVTSRRRASRAKR
jgi:hypothetical protein